ncbi:cysteine hydrolase [Clostridium lacusfryxellense]|nr:cysteine hydrolase [Clostridium lacusfryxellense]
MVNKHRFNGFYNTQLEDVLRSIGISIHPKCTLIDRIFILFLPKYNILLSTDEIIILIIKIPNNLFIINYLTN